MWQGLQAARDRANSRQIADLFEDPTRFSKLSTCFGTLIFDYSKINLDEQALCDLISLAEQAGLADKRSAMFAGEAINETEDRPALHTALRNFGDTPVEVAGEDVLPGVRATLARMEAFANDLRSGAIQGQGGPITDVVNIGIGGSDLGPVMAMRALAPNCDGPRCHFVSNVDGAHLSDSLKDLDPTTTLVIVSSKSFTTQETMLNARSVRDWMAKSVSDPAAQFVAISTNEEETGKFGISRNRVFGFEDWVGGRYSIWGPIGLSLMLAIGPNDFKDFLRGAEAMDRHFREADLRNNMPVLLALVGVWHNQVMGLRSRAVIPYDQRLNRLPAYLQQLEMESNGKSVAMDGTPLTMRSGPIVWGAPGTNGQHAFFQLLHQGTEIVPCEFLVAAEGHEPHLSEHHDVLVANCLAQAQALMTGRNLEEARALCANEGLTGERMELVARHRVFDGNRPSTTLIYPKLTPNVLGQILALYEHRVFVEGVILGINSFDQWGVELGKQLGEPLLKAVTSGDIPEGTDSSTAGLLSALKDMRG